MDVEALSTCISPTLLQQDLFDPRFKECLEIGKFLISRAEAIGWMPTRMLDPRTPPNRFRTPVRSGRRLERAISPLPGLAGRSFRLQNVVQALSFMWGTEKDKAVDSARHKSKRGRSFHAFVKKFPGTPFNRRKSVNAEDIRQHFVEQEARPAGRQSISADDLYYAEFARENI
jgi:hypothetical protein